MSGSLPRGVRSWPLAPRTLLLSDSGLLFCHKKVLTSALAAQQLPRTVSPHSVTVAPAQLFLCCVGAPPSRDYYFFLFVLALFNSL